MNAETRAIGEQLRRIRRSRGKSQSVIAGLAGISTAHLSRLESGKRALDRRSLIIRLANALEVAPSELTRIPMPAPGNGHTDSAIEGVRHALDAVDVGRPGGLVLPVDVLRNRVARLQEARRRCRFADVADDLPGLIRDVHTSIDAGRDVGELLELTVFLHVQVTSMWLQDAGAPVDLRREVVSLARRVAREHGEDVTLGMAALATTGQLISYGHVDLAQAELDSLTLPATTSDKARGLVGLLTVMQASIAAVDNRPGDVAAPMEAATELAERFGETGENPIGFTFGPTHVAWQRMRFALEAGEPDRAVSIAEGVRPERHPFVTCQAAYWTDVGRAAAQLRGRRDDAVRALLTAENLFPERIYRDPFARDAIAGLVAQSRDDSIGRELRKMAHRAGLPGV